MNWNDVVTLALRYPHVEPSVSYGEPSLKVRSKLLTRFRLKDDSLVLLDVVGEEREDLIARCPAVFFLEPHYRDYDIVLARVAAIRVDRLDMFLERRWRAIAPKRALAAFVKL